MNNILVTGATGFIGSHLVNHLSNNPDNKIYGLARSIKQESTFKALKLSDKRNVNLIFGNVNSYPDIEEIIATFDIDTVYHLASQPIVQIAAKAPVSTYSINVMGTINILEATRVLSQQTDKKISIMIMSSDKSYGNSNVLPYCEDTTLLNGSDIYSSSKAAEDIIARSYAYNYDMNVTVARPANTYGLDFHWTRLIPTIAKTCFSNCNNDRNDNNDIDNNRELILNKGSYHYVREFNYVKDTVLALETLVDNIDKTKGQAYNVGSGTILTTEQLVDKFLDIADTQIKLKFKEKSSIFKEIENQYLDCTKIRQLGWKPQYTIEQGLEETIDDYKNWFDI